MPLGILIALIAFGLPLVIGLVYLMTRHENQDLLAAETSISMFYEAHPDLTIDQVIVSQDGRVAAALFKAKAVGLICIFGGHHVTRVIEPGFVRKIVETDKGIDLRLHDFTLKRVIFSALNDNDRRDLIAAFKI